MGDNDQVLLRTVAEIRRLPELDPKLWGALSCPADGLEYDKASAAILDTDGDGRIRVPEVLEAVNWTCARLADTVDLSKPQAAMPLSAIDTSKPEGQHLGATARALLSRLGHPENESISQEEAQEAADSVDQTLFNGDGVIPASDELEPGMKEFVEAGIAVCGGAKDASGKPGLNTALAKAFEAALRDWLAWRDQGDAAEHPAGADTQDAWDLLEEIRAKVDDYFLRCRLAAFAPGIEAPVNAEEKLSAALQENDLSGETLSALPLSHVTPDGDLRLATGLNPIWRDRVTRFFTLTAPLLADPQRVSWQDWQKIRDAFAPFGAALAARPAVAAPADGSFSPASDPAKALDALGVEKARKMLENGVEKRFEELADKDVNGPEAARDIKDLRRLVLMYLHLGKLLQNFVSFVDFYSLGESVTFRAGTLYIDGRSCKLCVPAADLAAHSRMASLSQLPLLYCQCTRRSNAAEKRLIMAAVTAGSEDYLVEGRNGVFVDNEGNDWDAVLVKIIHNPISIRQAVWAPYKRLRQMAGDAIAKYAASKANTALADAAKLAKAPADKAPAGGGFDIGKSAGIFAAVGLALGALGTAVGSIANALFSLTWWQFPLLIIGIFVVISGPSALLAWLKLRRRNLAPVLEASGWAVNSQLPINLKLGAALTQTAVLPPDAERLHNDPLHQESGHAGFWLALILIAAIALGGWLWSSGRLAKLLPAKPAVTTSAPAPAAPAEPAPAGK